MNLFDDLADPLGPPPGDALGIVLGRARRRRTVRRSAAAFVAAAAVVAVAVSAHALTQDTSAVHIQNPPPAAPAPTSSASSSSTSTSSTLPTTTTTGTTPGTTPAASTWSDPRLEITTHSLGRVQVGMTLAKALTAAGLAFDGHGDGAYYPTTLPAGFPHLFVDAGADGIVTCVGAEIGDQATNPQTVVTPEGFRLGDTARQLQAIYGGRARFVPAQSGGISPRAGYVVTETDGNLAFYLDSTNTRIFGIKGGGHDLTPSTCNG